SGAGRFQSILDVNVRDSVQIAQAVDTVIESYTRDGRTVKDADEILVQPQVTDVASSGVMFSRDLEIKAPYHTINIDRHSKRPDVVTSGTAGHLDTSFVAWNADRDLLPDDIRRLVCLAEELMELTQLDALDIEFLFDSRQELYLLQVRPMPLGHSSYSLADTDLLDTVSEARRFIAQNSGPSPILAGSTTIFGNMPDWNPAEMIGKTPRPLALSLYQALIGDFHWASARADIGYRDVTPEPLVVAIGGKPYIDVRTSLNSFLPASIDREFAGAWIDDCLARLAARPELHDKVEFEVLPTCLAFDWDVHHGHMRAAGLSASAIDQYRAQLAKLTSTILRDREIPISKLLADVQGLESIHQLRRQDGADSAGAFARRAQLLLIDCGRYGLRPFSILARYAFISLAILKSLVSSGVLSRSDMDRFLQSIPTVASEFTSDLEALRSGAMSKELFVEQYGHLRPNSYEITSPNYASGFERYIGQGEAGLFAGNDCKPGRFEPNASNEADRALQSLGLEVSAGQLFEFMRAAIAGREKAKFEFMKSVNSILESITKFGEFIGLSTGELSHLHVNEVLQHAKSSMNGSSASHLKRQASFKKKQMEVTRAFRTPDLIRHADEVLYFEQETWKPNFVTQKTLQAEVVDLPGEPDNRNLEGKIVLIQAADPGYDWIFGHRIAGLITEYGGIGSHMAIRAAEFSLPAAIGCGGVLFEQVRNARRVELDCANERLKVLA
ncbi:MAG: hypothetical protein HKO64_09320, partial [Xanthomonadales bacterium]|nr:hypothetical protein [Xanthomonadales bacterium]